LGFNLAFSGDRVGYIWGPKGKSLGIDLEVPSSRKADRYWAVAERFFSPEERKWLVNQEDKGGWSTFVDSFYTLWCRKEALVKAFGVSIGSHADICPVLGDGSGDFFVNWEGLRWELTDLEVPGLYGAKALQI